MTNREPTATTGGPRRPAGSGETRTRILDAAAEVLSRKGYAGTRLSDIAEIVEIKSPAIYRHFPSREALFDEVMTVGHLRFIEHVSSRLAAMPDGATPLDRVLAAVAGHLEVVLAISDYAAASTRNMSQMPEWISERQRQLRREYGDIWRRLLQDAADAGQLRPGLSLYAAQGLIIGALSWSNEWWDPERRSLESWTRNAQDMVRYGIGR